MFDDMLVYMLIGGVAIIIILRLLFIRLFRKYITKITEMLLQFKKKFIMNGMIRSILIAYMKILVSVCIQIRMWQLMSPYSTKSS